MEEEIRQHQSRCQADQLLQVDHEEEVHEVGSASYPGVDPPPFEAQLHQPAKGASAGHPGQPLGGGELGYGGRRHDDVAIGREQQRCDRGQDPYPGIPGEGDDPAPRGQPRDAGIDRQDIQDVTFAVLRQDAEVGRSESREPGDQERQVGVRKAAAIVSGVFAATGRQPTAEELRLDERPRAQEQLDDRHQAVAVVLDVEVAVGGDRGRRP